VGPRIHTSPSVPAEHVCSSASTIRMCTSVPRPTDPSLHGPAQGQRLAGRLVRGLGHPVADRTGAPNVRSIARAVAVLSGALQLRTNL
jgi:hypothetical protein